jgi:hypothetical protein
MQCEYGAEVTFTRAEPGYRLQLYNQTTVSVILSRKDVLALLRRMIEVVLDDEDE